MPKLPSKWHCSGNYDGNNSSCDQWDNTSNYKHDISWKNNGDHVLQLAVMMSFVNRIIRKCMGQWQCRGLTRISDKTEQADNRLRCSYCCCIVLWVMCNDNMNKQLKEIPLNISHEIRCYFSVRNKCSSFLIWSPRSFVWLRGCAWGCCSAEGKCDGLKPISERCNLSLLTSAETGVFSRRPDNTGEATR